MAEDNKVTKDIYGSLPISATSASIKFDGQVVGYLQNLRIKEDFNIRQVNEIGNNIGAGYVAGAYSGEATARKAFIETNLLIDILKPAINANAAAAMGIKDFTKFLPENAKQKADLIVDVAKVASDIISTFKGDRVNKNNFIITFDIEVTVPKSLTKITLDKTGLDISRSNSISDIQEGTLILLKKCIITSREITIDIDNLVVMNNLSIRFLNREQ